MSPRCQRRESGFCDRVEVRAIVAGAFEHDELLRGQVDAKILEYHAVERLDAPTADRNLDAAYRQKGRRADIVGFALRDRTRRLIATVTRTATQTKLT